MPKKSPPPEQNAANQGLNNFCRISVRESSGAESLKSYFGIEAEVVPDPTLLLDAADYDKLLEEVSYKRTKHAGIFCYILDMTSEIRHAIETFASDRGMTVDFIQDYQQDTYPDVRTWLDGIRSARLILTNSFHGTAFSIIYGKPMWVLENEMRGNTRLTNLLATFKLSSRMIPIKNLNEADAFKDMDTVAVKNIHKALREQGMAFLEKAGIVCANK